jgi:tetratricopeptide (TPR) repeat protein
MMDAAQHQARAWALQAEGRVDEAYDALCAAIDTAASTDGPVTPDVANLRNELAQLEYERERFEEALVHCNTALDIEAAAPAEFSGSIGTTIRLATHNLLGELHRLRGDYGQAGRHLQTALEVASGEFGDVSSEAADAQNNLAVFYKYSGNFDAANLLYQQSLAHTTALYGPDSLEVAVSLHNIGGLKHAQGQFAAAEEPGRRAWEISRRHLGENHPTSMADAAAYAAILDGLERYAESELIHNQVLAFMVQHFGEEHTEVAATLHNLAAVLDRQGRFGAAQECYRRALHLRQSLLGADSIDVALTRNNLGRLLYETRHCDEAVTLLSSAVATLESQLPPDHPSLLAARRNLAQALAGSHPG